MSFSQTNVLVIDDSMFARKNLSTELKKIGFKQIFEAESVKEAIRYLHAHQVGLILCDNQMPGITGTEFLHKIRHQQQFNGIPFIIVTGQIEPKVIAEVADYDGDGVIVKPFSAATISQKILGAMGKRRIATQPTRHAEGLPTPIQDNQGVSGKLPSEKPQLAWSAKDLLIEGLWLESHGNMAEAKEKYQEAVTIELNFIKAHEALSRIYENEGNTDKYIAHLKETIKLNPFNFQRRFKLAKSLSEANRAEEAVEILRQMLGDGCAYPELLQRLTDLALKLDALEEARLALERSLETEPKQPPLIVRLAEVYSRLGKQELAEETVRLGLTNNPKNPLLSWHLAELLDTANKQAEAVETLKLVLVLDPGNKTAQALLDRLGEQAKPKA